MKKLRLLVETLCATFLLYSPTVAQAQYYTSTNRKAVAAYESGISAMQQSDIPSAIASFQQAIRLDPDFVEPYLTLGDYSLEAALYAQAEHYYTALLQRNIRSKRWREEAEKGARTARFRQQMLDHPVPFEPINLGPSINSQYEEYFPALTVDDSSLVFTRRFPRNQHTTANTPEEEDLYISRLGKDGAWQQAQRISEPLNSHDNEGAQCISQDGRIMFFTACGREDGAGRCDIYMCVRRGGRWSKPRNLGPAVNSGGWESQPSFSIDGRTLYFVSDRPGGYGGMDIWMTTFENGHFTTPQNLGPEVNTAEDETCPFIHFDDQTLYFASKGHVGMGGSDLYLSRRQADGSWGQAQNLGYPINTEADESGLVVDFFAQKAYMASNRLGGYGGMDIFCFDLPVQAAPRAVYSLNGTVTDAKTGKPMAANIEILDLGDGIEKEATGRVVANTSSDDVDGRYSITLVQGRDYAVNVSAKGYLFHSSTMYTSYGLEEGTTRGDLIVAHDIQMQPIEKGASIRLDNIFFDVASSELVDMSHVELDKLVDLLGKNPSLRVEIGGHTDNVGSEADNQKLSEARAKAVYDYLVAHGIDPARLSFAGFGASQPVADNATPEGRQLNRRTVMRIL